MKYSKKDHMVCLEKDELEIFFCSEMLEMLDFELKKRSLKIGDLRGRDDLMQEISSAASVKLGKDNDRIEVFAAWNIFLNFYEDGSSACFELKPGFNFSKDSIGTLDELKKAQRKNTLTDFAIFSRDGVRKFQLKRYSRSIDTESIFGFIAEKIAEYGSLGDTNLLIILQPKALIDIGTVGFKDLHKKISDLGYAFGGEILISYNEENKFNVINRVYPELGTSRVPIKWRDPKSVPKVNRG